MKRDANIVIRVPQKVKDNLTAVAKKEKIALTALLDRYLSIITEVPQKTVAQLLKSYQKSVEQATDIQAEIDDLEKHRAALQAQAAKMGDDIDRLSRMLTNGKGLVKQAESEYQGMRDTYIDINAAIATAAGAIAADKVKSGAMN